MQLRQSQDIFLGFPKKHINYRYLLQQIVVMQRQLDEEAEDDKDYSYSDVSDAVETPSPGAKGSEFISFNPNVGKQFLCKLSKR